MRCGEYSLKIPLTTAFTDIKTFIDKHHKDQLILRFIASSFDKSYFKAHILTAEACPHTGRDIFAFRKRKHYYQDKFIICFMIPTGIGCEIGGHAGDASAVLKLTASLCDKVITHPNVVNASDLNEMPSNALYVEGSHLTELLMGTIGLSEVRANKVLVVIDADKTNNGIFKNAALNSVNAARSVLGLDADTATLNVPVRMNGGIKNNKALGHVNNIKHLYEYLKGLAWSYDAVALTSPIAVGLDVHKEYISSKGEMINPWGAAEAMLTHFVSQQFDLPSAHAPMMEDEKLLGMDFGVVDSRIAPELVSLTFLHCILKGLHKAPKIVRDYALMNNPNVLSAKDISVLVVPDGILGLPILAALHQGIKVIAVKNKNTMNNDLDKLPWGEDQFIQCDSYLEAVGVLACIKLGLNRASVVRF